MTDASSLDTSRNVQISLADLPTPIGWLPNETIYSLASRYHALAGHANHQKTARVLFGRNRGGFPHDFPGGVAYFANAFSEQLGQAKEIVRDRTVLPLFVAFRSGPVRHRALTTMEHGSIGGLKSILGLPASRLGASLPLKACSSCMAADRVIWGTPYWHLEHQLPGACFCIKHRSPLLASASNRSGRTRYQWLLPWTDDLEQSAASIDEGSDSATLVWKISEFLSGLWKMSVDGPVCVRKLAFALRGRLVRRGLASPQGRLKASQASRQFHQLARSVGEVRDLSGIASSEGAAYSHILSLLAAHEHSHPVRVAAALAWLFDDWKEFSAAYNDPGLSRTHCMELSANRPEVRPEKGALAERVKAGESVSEAARKCGIQVATAQAWLVQQGVAIPKRPSIVKGDARQRAIAALSEGADKAAVSKEFGWSASAIERLLRAELGLKLAWKEARHRSDRDDARKRWMIALKDSDGRAKMARAAANSAYAWLYRNDREWLQDAIQIAGRPRRQTGPRIDWIQRDLELLGAARRAVDAILREGAETPLSLLEILRRVPDLRAKIRRIQDLPQTQRFLDSVRRRSRGRLL